jgi:ABC-type phosphate/phosphonate transport system permease subunit
VRTTPMNSLFENKIKEALENQQKDFENANLVWQRIEKKRKSKNYYIYKTLIKYAAIIVPAAIVISIVLNQNKVITGEQYFKKLNKDFEEKELYYNNLILSKYDELKIIPAEDLDMLRLFFEELEHLDELYNDQKEELIISGYNQDIIESMIETKKLKLDILNTMITEYNHIKKLKNETSHNLIEHI